MQGGGEKREEEQYLANLLKEGVVSELFQNEIIEMVHKESGEDRLIINGGEIIFYRKNEKILAVMERLGGAIEMHVIDN